MIILPAIDLKNGECVRLYQGDFDTVERVADSAIDTALTFQKQGAAWLHMVDLDAALTGQRTNEEVVLSVMKETNLKVEIGGGIRKIQDIDFYINAGISRVILGSVAVSNPDFVKEAVKEFDNHVAVGIDAKNEMVAAHGWTTVSNMHYLDLARFMEDAGVEYIIYTDISKDGMLEGPNLNQLKAINEAVSCHIIASGGITNSEDIKNTKALDVYGTICGRSIYAGTLSVEDAINIAGEQK